MSAADRIMVVSAILAVPWTVLAGLLWWNPARMQGSPPPLRYAVYFTASLLTTLAITGIIR